MATSNEIKQPETDELSITPPSFIPKDEITISAEILSINNEKNTYTIKLPPTPGLNQPAKIIEIDQSYVSNCIKSPTSPIIGPSSPSNIPTSFFKDYNISKSIVISRWSNLIKNTNNIDFNDDNIDPSSTMEIESSQECDAWFLKECPQTQRLSFILNVYKIWIEKQSKNHMHNINLNNNSNNNDEFISITEL
eukprot:132205_1